MPATRRHSRVWVVVLAVLAVTAAGANWFFHFHHSGDLPSPADHRAAEDGGDPLRVVAFGHVDVEFGVRSLYPLQPGRVADVPVHEGDTVRSGAPLLTLDERPAQYVLRQARADLKAAQAMLTQAKQSP